jgi:uncharacterized protein YodC (DUF2158 family)
MSLSCSTVGCVDSAEDWIMTFKPGDVVLLRSGGPSMTVVSVDEDEIKCVWIGEEGELFRETIPPIALDLVETEDDLDDDEHEHEHEDEEDDRTKERDGDDADDPREADEAEDRPPRRASKG